MAKKKKALQQEHKNEKAIARGHDIVCTHPPLFEALCHAVYMQYEVCHKRIGLTLQAQVLFM